MNFIPVDATDEKASSFVQVIIDKPLTNDDDFWVMHACFITLNEVMSAEDYRNMVEFSLFMTWSFFSQVAHKRHSIEYGSAKHNRTARIRYPPWEMSHSLSF